MTWYQDEHASVEIFRSRVVIVAQPLEDPERARELKRLFPESAGWRHLHAAVARVEQTDAAAIRAAEQAAHLLKSESSVPHAPRAKGFSAPRFVGKSVGPGKPKAIERRGKRTSASPVSGGGDCRRERASGGYSKRSPR